MLDRRNYVELVALLLVVVLFSLHLPLWGMIVMSRISCITMMKMV